MNNTIQTKIALKRLERLCETDFSFKPIWRLASALAQFNPVPSKQEKPALRALLAVVHDVGLFAPLPALDDAEVDENLSDAELVTRRGSQADRLARFLEPTCIQQGIGLPTDANDYATQVINRWQPTARTPEILVQLVRDYRMNRVEEFDVLCDEVERAFSLGLTLSLRKVEQICAMISVLDDEPLPVTYAEGIQRGVFFANVGMLAVRMSSRQDKASQAGAVALFEAVGANAMPIARMHVAKMWANGWGPACKTDFGHANELVDALYKQAADNGPFHPWLFHTTTGFKELLDLRIAIKRELILSGRQNTNVYRTRMKELADTMEVGTRCGFDYFTELAELCAPADVFLEMSTSREEHAKVLVALEANPFRQIIESDPVLRAHFREMHEQLLETYPSPV